MGFPILFLFLSSIFITDLHLITSRPDFWSPDCGDSGNYTQKSDYKQDLDDLLYALNRTNNGFGFYNLTSGQANGAALCRGDVDPDACQRCVDDATLQLIQDCPNQVEAMGWFDACFLRYSNRSMGYGGDSIFHSTWSNRSVSDSSYAQWNELLPVLFQRLRKEAAAGDDLRKYASGNVTAPGLSTIYAIMQCSPDLSATQCDECLAQAGKTILPYIDGILFPTGRYFLPGCVLRYDERLFFDSTWYPATPPSSLSPRPENSKSINIGVIVGPIFSVAVVIAILVAFIFRRRGLKRKRQGSRHEREDAGEMNSFNLSIIQVATNNFSDENKLGEGGFGPVYWGKLQSGKEIAVKRLLRPSGRGIEEFKTEVDLIIKLQHKNLVRLLGYCIKGTERLLIYEFMANNSLEKFLFDRNKCKELDWAKRANIVSGIAKGLRYLHEEACLKVIHRDMKAANILLDNELNSKISDFGIARIFGGNQLEANTSTIVGTFGYMAPEYVNEGLFSIKSDVYSFGVLLLEIISGQQNSRFCYQDQPQSFLPTAYRLWKENKGDELIDRRLIQNSPVNIDVLRWINIALLCVQEDPQDRPTMSTVIFMLEGQWSTNLPMPSEPPASFARICSRL